MMPDTLPDRMDRPSLPFVVSGGCHCGKIRFRATVRDLRMSECNCSMCTMKGFLHVIVPKEDFELLSGSLDLTTYRFNTNVAAHHFCGTCGVHSFYVPRSHPDGFSLNARCLEGIVVDWFDREPFDGRHWEARIHTLR